MSKHMTAQRNPETLDVVRYAVFCFKCHEERTLYPGSDSEELRGDRTFRCFSQQCRGETWLRLVGGYTVNAQMPVFDCAKEGGKNAHLPNYSEVNVNSLIQNVSIN